MAAQDPADDKYAKVFDIRGQSGYVPLSCLRPKTPVASPLSPAPEEENTPLPEQTEDLNDAALESLPPTSVINSPVGSPLPPTPEEENIPLPEQTEDLDDAAQTEDLDDAALESLPPKSAATSVINSPVGSPLSPAPEEENIPLPEQTEDLDDATQTEDVDDAALEGEG